MIKEKKFKTKKGFSVGEVMLSAFVLSVSMTAILSLVVSSLQSFMNSRSQIIASGLAQEGIELIVNVRDNNLIDGENDYFGLPAPVAGTVDVGEFCIDVMINNLEGTPNPILTNVNSCGTDSTNDLEYSLSLYSDMSNMFYAHDRVGMLGTRYPTRFKRKIMIENEDPSESSNDNKIVTSIVAWNVGSTFPIECSTTFKCVENTIVLKKR